jgi:hypothetical protein
MIHKLKYLICILREKDDQINPFNYGLIFKKKQILTMLQPFFQLWMYQNNV